MADQDELKIDQKQFLEFYKKANQNGALSLSDSEIYSMQSYLQSLILNNQEKEISLLQKQLDNTEYSETVEYLFDALSNETAKRTLLEMRIW